VSDQLQSSAVLPPEKDAPESIGWEGLIAGLYPVK
jgi:hypothetical protein